MSFHEAPSGRVVVIFNEHGAGLLELDDQVSGWRSISGEAFNEVCDSSDWLGFYDWLRNATGEVIGLRMKFDEVAAIPVGSKWRRFNEHVSEDRLLVFFGADNDICEALSDDTDFGGNSLLVGDRGSVGITFNRPSRRSPL